jgi:hypothetical protein
MKTKKTKSLMTLLLTAAFVCAQQSARSADNVAKQEMKAEERMKEEKKRDEQSARDYANRVKVARFDTVWRSPRSEDIDVFQEGEKVSRPYKAVALLTFECAAHEEAQAVAGFIAKAKDLGADGALMIGFFSPNSNQAVPNIFSPNDRRVFRANAIVYQSAR